MFAALTEKVTLAKGKTYKYNAFPVEVLFVAHQRCKRSILTDGGNQRRGALVNLNI